MLGDDNSTNEIQDLSRTGNTLSLTGDATSVDLALYLDNTDAQTLATQLVDANTRSISITGGNITNVDVRDADASITNEIQDLSLTLNTLSLSSDATTVNLAPYLDNTDNQDLSIVGNSLSLTNDASPVNLAPYLDNTDSQNLSSTISGTNRTLNISGGTGTTIDIADNDNSTTNEIQDLLLSTNTLSLSGDVTTVNLAPYLDNTDSQNLSSVAAGTNRQINISGGTGTTIDVADNDNNTTNEIQDLSINSATNILSLTSDATTVNLTPYLDNTDSQNLSSVVAGTNRQINISGGTSTTIDVADNDNSSTNEIQNLTYGPATNNLSISGGNNVTITTNLNQVLTTGAVAGGQRIQNIGTPTANADATTKQYVDDAIATAVAATFSFKVPYAFSSSGSPVTNQIVSFGAETYDDFNVLAANRFTVPSNGAGFYNIYIDGTSTNSPVTLKMRLNGTTIFTVKRQTSFPSALVINDFQIMLVKLAVGDFIELLVDSPNSGDQITGLFFGSKL